MTAEFATAMPAVVVVLALCLAGAQVASQQLRVQDAATAAARSLSRGEAPATVGQRVGSLVPGASVTRSDRGALVCATVTLPTSVGPGSLTLSATGCALAEGS